MMQNMSGFKPGKFVRLCNSLYEGGKMVPVEEWYNHVKNPNTDWYRSVGTYTPEQVEIFKSQKKDLRPGAKGEGKVAGITGVSADYLILDFDSEDDLEKARTATIGVLETLDKFIKPEQYNITFTGSKGFTIEMNLDKEYSGRELRTVAENLAGHFEEWDSSLYDENQILRVVGTRHPKTGLYKIPLTREEITSLSMEQIKEKAKSPGDLEWTEFPNSLPQEFFKSKKKEKVKAEVNLDQELDFTSNTLGMPNWKFAILHGYFPPGKRHESMLALAAYFKGAGFPVEITKNMVFEASRLQYERFSEHYHNDPTDEGELGRTIDHIYGPLWTGGTFAYETNEKLKSSIMDLFPEGSFEEEVEDEKPIKSVADMLSNFKKFAKNIDKNRIFTGIKEIDDKIMLTTGTMNALLGAPGSSKTTICINMLSNTSKMGIHSMFFSLDMSENLLGGQLMRRETDIGFRQLTEKYKQGEDLSEIEKLIEEDFKNVGFYSKSSTSVKEMRNQILKHQKNIGEKVKFVVVDYLELISGPYADLTANSAHHAVQLKDLSTDLDICLLVLVQPQKSAGDASFPLNSMRQVKGASLLEQNFRNILGIYREGFSPDTPELDKFLTIKGLKSTFEGLFSVDVGWDGKTGRVYTLNDDGHRQLKRLRDSKLEKKEEKNDW